MSSLKRLNKDFSNANQQIELLNNAVEDTFAEKLKASNLFPLKSVSVDTFQINLGKMCNQECKHCHVDAGPDRKEIMTKQTMQECLDALDKSSCTTVDLTGGAPEMNPDFRWFVEQLSSKGKKIIVRCNLTIIVANPKYNDLPEFYKKHKVEVVSSLPHFTSRRTDAQRGDGVFDRSIKALKMLNEVGYGIEGSGLTLNLVYNPSGAFLPGDQKELEKEFKSKLTSKFDISFNNLFTITNLPVSRFLDYLVNSGNLDEYFETLVNAYNPVAASEVMCRSLISISWDGLVYDCDFNQMLELEVNVPSGKHIKDFVLENYLDRSIIVNQHCYGCTAGAGSSCGGTTA